MCADGRDMGFRYTEIGQIGFDLRALSRNCADFLILHRHALPDRIGKLDQFRLPARDLFC